MGYSSKLLKIRQISGTLYTAGRANNTILIYGIGAPRLPDSGDLVEAGTILKNRTDIFVPDYIGYGRSGGTFSPINCIRTFLTLHDAFINGCTGINYAQKIKRRLKYKRVIIVGKSFGGRYVPLLPRFDRNIKEIGIFCPALNTGEYGKRKVKEESVEGFLRCIRYDGYSNLYRGLLKRGRLDGKWKRHLEDEDSLAPMKNLRYLKGVRIFIGHGRLDKIINFSRSVSYYKKLKHMYPDKGDDIRLKLYKKGDHGASTTVRATKDFLKWIN